MSDPLHDRGNALEDLFFHNRDQELLEQLKANMTGGDAVAALSKATGIHDDEVLKRLADSNISSETLTSFSLVPLVMVAWADGKIQDEERAAIMKAGEESGLHKGDPAAQLLETWLQSEPADDLFAAWKSYVASLKTTVTQEDFAHMKSKVIGRAKHVADTAGGFLGLTSRTSSSEQAVIQELEAAFDGE